jgi:uncharacterized membrane protein
MYRDMLSSVRAIQEDGEKQKKREFQVERIAFFSDAVFAIAITLLIIEFRVPHVTRTSTFESIFKQVVELKGVFTSVLCSFYFIISYWTLHHFLFKFIHNYNRQIINANSVLLLVIIFFPFTTTFMGESADNPNVTSFATRLFLLNNILASLTTYCLYWFTFIKYRMVAFEMTEEEKRGFLDKTIFMAGALSIGFVTTFIFPGNNAIASRTIIFSVALKGFYDIFFGKPIRQQKSVG